jgi:hypothetical protein
MSHNEEKSKREEREVANMAVLAKGGGEGLEPNQGKCGVVYLCLYHGPAELLSQLYCTLCSVHVQ